MPLILGVCCRLTTKPIILEAVQMILDSLQNLCTGEVLEYLLYEKLIVASLIQLPSVGKLYELELHVLLYSTVAQNLHKLMY